jgi:pimeloyl-ACP methyl ester carboxylesterase
VRVTETRTVVTGDGRTLTYCLWGPPDGAPVFWLHGAPGSRLVRHRDESYERAGARVITYDRPGYGGSTRQPGRSVVWAADDVIAIADALGFGEFGVGGVSGGGPHALAVAARHAGRVARCATVVSLGPYGVADLDFFAGMSPEDQEAWHLAEQSADTLAARLLSDIATLVQALKAGVPMPGMGDWDRQMLIDALGAASAQGAGGTIDELLAMVRPWGFDVADIPVPTRLMVAREDRAVPLSHGRWLAGHISGAVLEEVPGGHFGPRDEEEAALIAWLAAPDANESSAGATAAG